MWQCDGEKSVVRVFEPIKAINRSTLKVIDETRYMSNLIIVRDLFLIS